MKATMLNKFFVCSCWPKPTLGQVDPNGQIFIRKQGFLMYFSPPAILVCGNCQTWYSINTAYMMKKIAPPAPIKTTPHVCVNCNYAFMPKSVKDSCPKCHYAQATVQTNVKQTR